jgi:hypothetical protein
VKEIVELLEAQEALEKFRAIVQAQRESTDVILGACESRLYAAEAAYVKAQPLKPEQNEYAPEQKVVRVHTHKGQSWLIDPSRRVATHTGRVLGIAERISLDLVPVEAKP